MSARTQPERSERFTAGSGKVAHLFRRLDARTLKILSVKRRHAGRLDVRVQPSSSALDLHTGGPPVWHGRVSGSCHTGGPAIRRARARRVASSGDAGLCVDCERNVDERVAPAPPGGAGAGGGAARTPCRRYSYRIACIYCTVRRTDYSSERQKW